MKLLSEKLSGRNPINIAPEGLPSMDLADSLYCPVSSLCKGEQHEDFCGSPLGEEVWQKYCIEYRNLTNSLVEGAEVLFGKVFDTRIDLKENSQANKILRNGGLK